MSGTIHERRVGKTVDALRKMADPMERLAAVRDALTELERLELATVIQARAAGATWGQIGRLYGMSKQGAQQRFRAARDDRPTD